MQVKKHLQKELQNVQRTPQFDIILETRVYHKCLHFIRFCHLEEREAAIECFAKELLSCLTYRYSTLQGPKLYRTISSSSSE